MAWPLEIRGHPSDPRVFVWDRAGSNSRYRAAMRRAGRRVVTLDPPAVVSRRVRATQPRDAAPVEAAADSEKPAARTAAVSLHPTISMFRVFSGRAGLGARNSDHVGLSPETARNATLNGPVPCDGRLALIRIFVAGFYRGVLPRLSQPAPTYPWMTHRISHR
ncbi:hypothetical protein P6F26_09545 [Roseibacterium sp. SDUM158017]|uniref:hypothetical protein n=1 Tax=Roseicyclus salinarum TaxID=3036773 RepID=UPI00241590C4|nr:hypothetical protein [Roseibacterium sp. SDUM158017]MDG4648691.1 hypothetical protein [Roseibacterium sp. SDUM158017]